MIDLRLIHPVFIGVILTVVLHVAEKFLGVGDGQRLYLYPALSQACVFTSPWLILQKGPVPVSPGFPSPLSLAIRLHIDRLAFVNRRRVDVRADSEALDASDGDGRRACGGTE